MACHSVVCMCFNPCLTLIKVRRNSSIQEPLKNLLPMILFSPCYHTALTKAFCQRGDKITICISGGKVLRVTTSFGCGFCVSIPISRQNLVSGSDACTGCAVASPVGRG